jgi:hypothetical protein
METPGRLGPIKRILSTTASVIALVAAIVSAVYAYRANDAATEANQIARDANQIAKYGGIADISGRRFALTDNNLSVCKVMVDSSPTYNLSGALRIEALLENRGGKTASWIDVDAQTQTQTPGIDTQHATYNIQVTEGGRGVEPPVDLSPGSVHKYLVSITWEFQNLSYEQAKSEWCAKRGTVGYSEQVRFWVSGPQDSQAIEYSGRVPGLPPYARIGLRGSLASCDLPTMRDCGGAK